MKRRLKPLTVEALQLGADASRPTSSRSKASRTSGATGAVLPVGGKKKEANGKKEEKKKEEKKAPEETMEDKMRAMLKSKQVWPLLRHRLRNY
jgi:hypothetical protein